MFSEEDRERAIRMYRLSGDPEESAKLVGASARTVRRWADGDRSALRRTCGKSNRPYGEETRAEALALVESGKSLRQVAEELGISGPNVVRSWVKGSGTKEAMMPEKIRRPEGDERAYSGFSGDESERIRQLELENDILRGVVDLLKARGLGEMSNREKALAIDALRRKTGRPLRELTDSLRISKSSYEYQRAALRRGDKYAGLRADVRELFDRGGRRWGYRTIWAKLRESGVRVSEKVVRRIMREEGCRVVYLKRRRRYCSYGGEISEAPENLVKRNFHAQGPNQLWVTDITEFRLPGGKKVYLSAVVDCFDGMVASWSIGRRPSARLANSSLEGACGKLLPGQRPICHSDRGCHYRWQGWISICERNGLVRSMSRKGCSPDNSACEGFFGRLKNEFFYYRDWSDVGADRFTAMLDAYLRYYNERRIKRSLGWMSPCDYRRKAGLAT